ncbi:MAG: hypothetical protein WD942_06540 [Dehalococcoidia bacterium]
MAATLTGFNVQSYTEQGEYRFETGEAITWEREASRRSLPSDLAAAPSERWLWCLECERAFQLGEVQAQGHDASCAYEDCGAAPQAFWQWESYRAFVGQPAIPARDAVFPLAAFPLAA